MLPRKFNYILITLVILIFAKMSFNGSYAAEEFAPVNFADSLYSPALDSLQQEEANRLKGRHLYEKKCNKCHTLYEPGEFKLKVWKENLKEMKIKADLSKEEYNLILGYLTANCKK